jgi:hypothetical protein
VKDDEERLLIMENFTIPSAKEFDTIRKGE